jgi:hypothetical protein
MVVVAVHGFCVFFFGIDDTLWGGFHRIIIAVLTVLERVGDVLVSWYVFLLLRFLSAIFVKFLVCLHFLQCADNRNMYANSLMVSSSVEL